AALNKIDAELKILELEERNEIFKKNSKLVDEAIEKLEKITPNPMSVYRKLSTKKQDEMDLVTLLAEHRDRIYCVTKEILEKQGIFDEHYMDNGLMPEDVTYEIDEIEEIKIDK